MIRLPTSFDAESFKFLCWWSGSQYGIGSVQVQESFFFFFFKGKSFDSIAIVFLSELVLVMAGLEVDNVLLTDQNTGGQSVIF